MTTLSDQSWQNQIQALEATLAEMQKRAEAAERDLPNAMRSLSSALRERGAYYERCVKAEAEVARLRAMLPPPANAAGGGVGLDALRAAVVDADAKCEAYESGTEQHDLALFEYTRASKALADALKAVKS